MIGPFFHRCWATWNLHERSNFQLFNVIFSILPGCCGCISGRRSSRRPCRCCGRTCRCRWRHRWEVSWRRSRSRWPTIWNIVTQSNDYIDHIEDIVWTNFCSKKCVQHNHIPYSRTMFFLAFARISFGVKLIPVTIIDWNFQCFKIMCRNCNGNVNGWPCLDYAHNHRIVLITLLSCE